VGTGKGNLASETNTPETAKGGGGDFAQKKRQKIYKDVKEEVEKKGKAARGRRRSSVASGPSAKKKRANMQKGKAVSSVKNRKYILVNGARGSKSEKKGDGPGKRKGGWVEDAGEDRHQKKKNRPATSLHVGKIGVKKKGL